MIESINFPITHLTILENLLATQLKHYAQQRNAFHFANTMTASGGKARI